ncbi:MAG TPA: hypothetical protein VIU15_26230, partial [Streptomyces sp.]
MFRSRNPNQPGEIDSSLPEGQLRLRTARENLRQRLYGSFIDVHEREPARLLTPGGPDQPPHPSSGQIRDVLTRPNGHPTPRHDNKPSPRQHILGQPPLHLPQYLTHHTPHPHGHTPRRTTKHRRREQHDIRHRHPVPHSGDQGRHVRIDGGRLIQGGSQRSAV